jgi:hypothetical protein
MTKIQQLMRSGQEKVKRKTKSPALKSCPQKKAICTRVYTTTPKKPNLVQCTRFVAKKAFLNYTITDSNFEIEFLKDLFIKVIDKYGVLNYAFVKDVFELDTYHKNHIEFNVLFIFRILKSISREVQKTAEFYSFVYVQEDNEWDYKQYRLKCIKTSGSERLMKILFSQSTLILTAYSTIILFFPEKIIIIKFMNYSFGFISFISFINSILKICSSARSRKIKLKKIFDIMRKFVCKFLLISGLNILFMAVFKIIEFEKNLSLINKNIITTNEKNNMRRNFYYFLGVALLFLVCTRFGCGFSIGSKNSSTDSNNGIDTQQKEIPKETPNQDETDNEDFISRVFTFIGYQDMFEHLNFFDSLPDAKKRAIGM